MKVSIIVIAKNHSIGFKQALESAYNQSYKSIEIIVVFTEHNDCNKISDSSVKVLYLKDENVFSILKVIKEKITGNSLLVLYDDTFIDSDYISECISFLEMDNRFIAVCGKFKFYWLHDYLYEKENLHIHYNCQIKRVISFYEKETIYNRHFNSTLYRKEELFSALDNINNKTLVLSNLVFKGKFQTLSNIYSHKQLRGDSEGLEYSNSKEYIFTYVLVNILFNTNLYKRLNFIERIYLALAIFLRISYIIVFNKN